MNGSNKKSAALSEHSSAELNSSSAVQCSAVQDRTAQLTFHDRPGGRIGPVATPLERRFVVAVDRTNA